MQYDIYFSQFFITIALRVLAIMIIRNIYTGYIFRGYRFGVGRLTLSFVSSRRTPYENFACGRTSRRCRRTN